MLSAEVGFAVGTVIADRPRANPYVRNYRTRLLPRMMHGRPCIRMNGSDRDDRASDHHLKLVR
jgi:hypothetical protein